MNHCKGKTPMTKNVNVVDDLGNRYVPTYAKRAKGLVKNGRARWVDENTICLACPPDDIDLEDAKMDKNKINPIDGIVVEPVEKGDTNLMATVKVAEKMGTGNGVTMMDILERMDKIIAQGDELANVVQQIKDLPVNESPEGGLDGQARAEAIGTIYRMREDTNHRMLDMLNKMYDDMVGRPQQAQWSSSAVALETIQKMNFAGMMPETAKVIIDTMMGKTNT